MNGKQAREILHTPSSYLSVLVKKGMIRVTKSAPGRCYDYNDEDVYRYLEIKGTYKPVPRKPRVSQNQVVTDFTPEELAEAIGITIPELHKQDTCARMSDLRRTLAALLRDRRYTNEQIGAILHRNASTVSVLLKNRHWVAKQIEQAERKLKSRQPH